MWHRTCAFTATGTNGAGSPLRALARGCLCVHPLAAPVGTLLALVNSTVSLEEGAAGTFSPTFRSAGEDLGTQLP